MSACGGAGRAVPAKDASVSRDVAQDVAQSVFEVGPDSPAQDQRDGAGNGGGDLDASAPPNDVSEEVSVIAPGGPCKFLFCEDFESVTPGSPPDPAIWTRTTNDIVVDTTDGALGTKKALHITVVNGFKYIREKKTIPAMGTSFYGRVWFRIDRRPLEKPNGLFHWTLVSADELDDYLQGKLIRLGGHIEGDLTNWLRFNFQTHGNPGETGLDDRSAVLDTKKWYCAEFYDSLPDQEARTWLDGTERTALHWKNSVPGYTFPASISQMSFGWAESHGINTPWEVWVDEIVLDTKKIGCGN